MALKANIGMLFDSIFDTLENVLVARGIADHENIIEEVKNTIDDIGLRNAIIGTANNCDQIVAGKFASYQKTKDYLNRPELVSQLEREVYSLRSLLSTKGLSRSVRVLTSLFKVQEKPGGSSTYIYASKNVIEKLKNGSFRVGDVDNGLLEENDRLRAKIEKLERKVQLNESFCDAETMMDLDNAIVDMSDGYATTPIVNAPDVYMKQAAEISRLHDIVEMDKTLINDQQTRLSEQCATIAALNEKVERMAENMIDKETQCDVEIHNACNEEITQLREIIADQMMTIAEQNERIHKLRKTVEDLAPEVGWRRARLDIYKAMSNSIDTAANVLGLNVEYALGITNEETLKVAAVVSGLVKIMAEHITKRN